MAVSGKAVLGLTLAGVAGVALILFLKREKPPEKGARRAPADGRGDINMDGWVSDMDIVLIKQIILGQMIPTEEEFRRADVNCDGTVNVFDQVAINNYMVTGEMPPCE